MSQQQSNNEVKAPETSVPQGYQPQGAGIYFVPVPATQPINYPFLQEAPQGQAPQGQAPSQSQTQPRVYYQQTNQFVPLTETPVVIAPTTSSCNSDSNSQQGGCQRRWGNWGWGCRSRRCGGSYGQNQGGCCWTPSNRPLGTVTEFFWNLVFATFVPILAPLVVFSLETSQLARLGALYGTADFFLAVAIGAFHFAPHLHHHPAGWIVAGVTLLIAIILFASSCRRFWYHLWQYEQVVAKNKAEGMTVVSEVGKRCEFIVSFLLSFFLPILGTLIRIGCRRTLQSRFGAMKGLAWFAIILGTVTAGIPILIGGLFLLQVSKLHFQRAIISASAASVNNNAVNV